MTGYSIGYAASNFFFCSVYYAAVTMQLLGLIKHHLIYLSTFFNLVGIAVQFWSIPLGKPFSVRQGHKGPSVKPNIIKMKFSERFKQKLR